MGLLHSRQSASPEAVSYHHQGACAVTECDNGSVIVDTSLSNSSPANDVIIPHAQVR